MRKSPEVLLGFDTDRIKEYVFGLDTLREIRGASALLDSLNRYVMRQEVGVEPLYANGGAALFVVDQRGAAEEARIRVEKEYREQTAGAASVTGVISPLPEGDIAAMSIQETFQKLLLAMRRAKDQPPETLALTTLPHLRPCDVCGTYPASESDPRRPRQLICLACQRRGQGAEGLRTRRGMDRAFDTWEELLKGVGDRAARPDEMSEIAVLSRPEGYVGLVYADGDDMGRALQDLKTQDDFRSFARDVDSAIFDATAEAVRQHLQPVEGRYPFDVLLLGGDDLVMLTRAQSALAAAATLVERFARNTRQLTQRPLSVSAGVVLAHAKFPFRLLFDLAESALKFAKRERARRKLAEGLINFLVVTSANHLDFKTYYNEELCRKSGRMNEPDLIRSLRPYTADGIRRLLRAAWELREAPRGKLQALRECVFEPQQQGTLEGLTILRRWRGNADHGRRVDQVNHIRTLVTEGGTGPAPFPWRSDGRDWRTPLLDLIEVFDFVEGPVP